MPNYKILVIDYEPRGIQQLCVPLEMAGYKVELAKDGLKGIEMFEEVKPDLTLIEAMIPKKHGFEVCEELKKTPHGMLTPIVIVTAVYKGRRYRTQALHHYRCDEYLEKPIAAEKLLEVVNRLLQESHANAPAAASPDPPAAKPATASPAPAAAATMDDAELEIMSRLDELLGGDDAGSASADEPTVDKTTVTKDEVAPPVEIADAAGVLSFDPDRTRARRQGTPPVADSRTGIPPVHSRGSAAEQPLPQRAPALRPEVAPRELSRPDPMPTAAPQQRSRLGWILLGVALGIIASAALFYFVRPL